MTTQGNGHSAPYTATMSQQTKAVLKSLHAQAVGAGTGQRFVAALRQIIQRLRSDPMTFGEPLYHLPALKLVVRQGIIAPLVVDYAVHEEKPHVCIRVFKALS
jgi:hypothetical protein